MLEVVEYSLKERFDMKYLHQVSYLHLQDVIGVCLSYCCLSGTTCIPVIVQYITTSLLLLSTAYCIIAVCVVVMYHRACISQGRGVLEIEEYLFKERFDTKYLHQVSSA